MNIDRTKLMEDIEALKEKLASMEKELNKPDEYKHFPSKGDEYYYYFPWSRIDACYAQDNKIKPNTYKTLEEANKAYKKAVALEKVKRRIVELQGDWKPDWKNDSEKYCIYYDHSEGRFKANCWYILQQDTIIPFMENEETAGLIIKEMEVELKLIFDIA